jgi:hypothetical protein
LSRLADRKQSSRKHAFVVLLWVRVNLTAAT